MASSKGSTTLPFDVVEDILYRTPIESLIRFKATCKQWYALFNDKRFIDKHLNLFPKRFIRIYHDKVEIINPVTLDLLCLPVPEEFGFGTFNIIISVIYCDGLLLCQCGNGRSGCNNLAVWNPLLSQIKWIEAPFRPYHHTVVYGFGYDNVSRDGYKILRFSFRCTEFEIYDFKSKLWRGLPATCNWYTYKRENVSMKGNMYWVSKTMGNWESELFIQSFDFSKETFKRICSFPFEDTVDYAQRISLDLFAFSGFGGDRLSLLYQEAGDETREIQVWVTNKVTDEVVSWSKYFNVTSPDLPLFHPHLYNHGKVPTFFIHKTNCIMLWCDTVVQEDYACASFYEIGEGEIKKQVETGQPYVDRGRSWSWGCVYVPSLVPVPE
ncbi:F-box associated interaction domain [Arabidopsis suecica]|uniref:F-box associated interaction domain n=1 Tax=Arabidopsis suecica TaxID=45249 RepID=A0A8T2BWV4_ARASU|nr:F-box associated interaction domain [Arabidopsis suecica]